MAYPSSQNAGYPGFRPQGPPVRGQSIPPPNIGPPGNMITSMPPKPGPGMNPPGMFMPTNGQIGQAPVGNSPYLQGPGISRPRPPPPNQNGLPQPPYNTTAQNSPLGYQFSGPSQPPSAQTVTAPGGMGTRPPGPGPSPTSFVPNGPSGVIRPPSSGPPTGAMPRGPPLAGSPAGGPPTGPPTGPAVGPPKGPPLGQQYRPPLPGGIPQVAVPPPGIHPQPLAPPQAALRAGDSRPPSSTPSSQDSSGRPGELPVPYHGQAQYSHQIGDAMRLTAPSTPSNSEPTSRKSSRAPSPVTSPTYDALEGQFTPNSQGPPSGHGTPPPLGSAPSSGSPGPATPQPEPGHRPGIMGRRVYPQAQGPGAPGPGAQQFRPPSGPQQYGSPQGQPGQQFGVPAGSQQLGGPPTQFTGPPAQQPVHSPPGQQFGSPPGRQMTGPPGVGGQFGAPPPSGGQLGDPPGSRGQFGGPPGPPSSYGNPPGPQGQQFGGPPGPAGPTGQTFGGPPGPPGIQSGQPGQQFGGPPGQQFTGYGQSTGPPSGPAGYQSSLPQTRYPPNAGQSSQPGFPQPTPNSYPGAMAAGFGQMSLQDNSRPVNLLQERKLIHPTGVETPKANLQNDFKKVNCSPEVFRCTLTSIPQTSSLLNKARLPLGILIHPFKDLSQLPVIQSSVIVRCRSCRTYINPFVYFVDTRRWKCNLCYRINDLPDEFSYDPISKTYGEPQRRPEVRSSTIEFIAPSEYMLRPPQPAVYLFVLDVSFNAIETGYLSVFCETLLEELDKLPGDARTHVGFVAFDRAVHFFNLAEGLSQPQLLTVSDIDDIFLPSPDNLLVNIHESKELVIDLLNQLPSLFEDNQETGNALGAALQAAYKMMSATGGRVTVVQTCLPSAGPGALSPREDPNLRKSKEVQNVGPATDFYKKLALDCSAQQIAVDLFLLNGQYTDVGTLACISKFSSGCIYSYPSFHASRNPSQRDRLECDLRRYLTRKIGFEAVMRIRCTKGLSIHTFHGNFFVRSTDLLSLPNINPDAGFGMQMSIEDSLTDSPTVCFQAALLYTSSKGERRIRVHTMCLPVTNQISEVFSGADQQCIVGLLAKMAADRTATVSLNEAREALINAALDSISAYGNTLTASQRAGNLMSAYSLRLVPLYVLALIKSMSFRVGPVTKLDDRVIALERCKTLPLARLIQFIHPDLYPVHALTDENGLMLKEAVIAQPPLLQLSSANLDRHGAFLLDTGDDLYLLIGSAISDQFCADVFDRPNFMALDDGLHELPELENQTSERLRNFINYLMDQRPQGVNFTVLRDDSKDRGLFFQHMVEDRTESTMSYYEFLQYLQKQLKG